MSDHIQILKPRTAVDIESILSQLSAYCGELLVEQGAKQWVGKGEILPTNYCLHSTEEKYPEQTKRFREILDQMYQVHLTKNADYSPYNILVTGMKGCVTRLWDKSARFFNLIGLDIMTYEWNEEKLNSVKDESINDTLIDWANYCIITFIFREGKLGK